MQNVVAWVLLPAVLLVVSIGVGALLRRLSGLPIPTGLLAPLGAALAIVLALAGYTIGLRGLLTPLVIVVLALAGLVLAFRGGARLPRPGSIALLWSAVYGLYMAPVVLTGNWTWPGYNFVNDTAVQIAVADWLPEHGRALPPERGISTTLDVLITYIEGGYPLGSHALLAAMHELMPIGLAELYHPFVSAFAGLCALALAVLVRPLVGQWWAAFAAFLAVANNLFYQYAMQGNMKEVVTAATLATTAAVAGWTLAHLRRDAPRARRRSLIASAALVAVPVSATVVVLSVAGAPYAGLIVLGWLAFALLGRVVGDARTFALALAAGAAVLVVGTATTVPRLITWGKTTTGTFATPALANDLGHLARPLELRQTAGVWLIGDYRFPPVGLSATLTTLGILLVVVLAVIGLFHLVRRRRFAVLLFALPVIVVMALVTPRVSPYADAKTLMLMAPAVTLLGGLGAAALGRLKPALGVVVGAVMLGGVLLSDAFAYHAVKLAPTDRMESLRDLDRRLAGDSGLALFNEPEEFAKVLLDDTRHNASTEAITPAQVLLRAPQAFGNLYFDLDEQTLEYVTRFPTIVVRRSPVASRPPASYESTYANEHYEVWRRTARPEVVEHLPLQGLHQVAAIPDCGEVTAMARRARRGQVLVAAPAPTLVSLDTVEATRSPGWNPHPYRPRMVLTGTPGQATASVSVSRPGRYRAWIAGSFGRPITAYVDSKPIGSAVGVNNVGQWHPVGTTMLTAGAHELEIRRPPGNFDPGDGYAGELGPLMLERIEERPLERVDPDDARAELCGREWDWIERVSP